MAIRFRGAAPGRGRLIAYVSPYDGTTPGSDSIEVVIAAGDPSVSSFCIAGAANQAEQSATLTASAIGFADASRPVNVVRPIVGLVMDDRLTAPSSDQPVGVVVGIDSLAAPGEILELQTPLRGGGPLVATVRSSNVSEAQLKSGVQAGQEVTVSIAEGKSAEMLYLQVLAPGTTTVAATISEFRQSVAPTVGPLRTNPRDVIITAEAALPALRFLRSADYVGAGLEICGVNDARVEVYDPTTGYAIPVTANTRVTIASSAPQAVLVSPDDDTTSGTDSVEVTIPANGSFATFCVAGAEGHANQSATLTARATGFGAGAALVSVVPPVVGLYLPPTLTVLAPDWPVELYVGIGSPTSPDVLLEFQQVRKGSGDRIATVSLSQGSVAQLKSGGLTGGEVTPTIPAGSYFASDLYLDPVAPETTRVTATIRGFTPSVGADYVNPRDVSIIAAPLRFVQRYADAADSIRVGAGLEACGGSVWVEVYEPADGSATPVPAEARVRIASGATAVALVRADDTATLGSDTWVTIPANSASTFFCVAGVEGQARQTATLTARADGFTDGIGLVSVVQPSVGIYVPPDMYLFENSPDMHLYVSVGVDVSSSAFVAQVPTGGANLTATVTSSDGSVAVLKSGTQTGAVVTVTLPAGSAYNAPPNWLDLDPIKAGTTDVTAEIAGFLRSRATSGINPHTANIAAVTTGTGLRIVYDRAILPNGWAINVGAGLEICDGTLRVEAYNLATGDRTNVIANTPVTITADRPYSLLVSPHDTTTPGEPSTDVTILANTSSVAFCLAGMIGSAATGNVDLVASGLGTVTRRPVELLVPLVGIEFPPNLTANSADAPIYVYVGIGTPTSPTSLVDAQQVPKGRVELIATVNSSNPIVAQLKGLAQAEGSTVKVGIPMGSSRNAPGTLYLDPISAGATAVSADMMPDFLPSFIPPNPMSVVIGP